MLKFIYNQVLWLFVTMCIHTIGFADQLVWINKNDAIRAVNFLNRNTEAILYCGCCEGDVKQKVHIYSARYSQVPEEKSYYKVSISYGVNGDSIAGWLDVDLAYIHSEIDGLWTSVGKHLGMECDPCLTPFTYAKSPISNSKSAIENAFNIGDYYDKSPNETHYLKITQVDNLGFKFEMQVGTAKMCTGEISGVAHYTSNKKLAIFKGSNGCSISFSVLPAGAIEVSEDNCGYFHGVECSFDAQFFRKK